MTADEIRKLFDAYEYNIKSGLSGLLERNYFESAIRAICDERDSAAVMLRQVQEDFGAALNAAEKERDALKARVVELEKDLNEIPGAF